MYDFVIFEGLDRVGKTSVKSYLELETNFKYICVDRMILTSIAYEKLKNRGNSIEELEEILKKLFKNFNPLYIYLNITDYNLISNRVENENEKILKSKEVKKLSLIYDGLFNKLKNKYIKNICIKNVDNCRCQEDYKNIAKEIIKDFNL